MFFRGSQLQRKRQLGIEVCENRYCPTAIAFDVQLVEAADLAPTQIQAWDLNGDVLEDVLYSTANHLVWHENNGDGTFGPPSIAFEVADPQWSFVVGDLDSNGSSDIVVAAPGASRIYLNDGNGSFSLGPTFETLPRSTTTAALGDMDGDGDVDLLVTTQGAQLAWYENVDGTLRRHSSIVIDELVGSLRLADFDHDGDLDVIAGARKHQRGPRVSLYRNVDGAGSLSLHTTIDIGTGGSDALGVDTGDLDGDGDFDIAFAMPAPPSPNQIGWLENVDGKGSYSEPRSLVRVDCCLEPTRLSLSDLNADGRLDLVVSYEGILTWYEQLEDGFARWQWIADDPPQRAADPIVVDLDRDGDLDLLGPHPHKGGEPEEGFVWFRSTLADPGIPLHGDANNDGVVSFVDFVILSTNYRRGNADWEDGDFTGDGRVDYRDFLLLAANYGHRGS